jgi:transcriptional regulator with XRE-family HTH domain/Zn-dependent peptidase ImmA (M78 family)
MEQRLNTDVIQRALIAASMQQTDLAKKLNVSDQAVSNWMKGTNFPRPDKLLKLAALLKKQFSDLVIEDTAEKPVVAFRLKANAKLTPSRYEDAVEVGYLLKRLVAHLPPHDFDTRISNPSLDYDNLQRVTREIRQRVGLGESTPFSYVSVLSLFDRAGAVLIPVQWGNQHAHANALHIRLPDEDLDFVFLNLDTRLADFNFWMAHELGHIYTPEHSGTKFGEDFADAFAGALLYPGAVALKGYATYAAQKTDTQRVGWLAKEAANYSISMLSVYKEIERYAAAKELTFKKLNDNSLHGARQSIETKTLASELFSDKPPSATQYIDTVTVTFKTPIFGALRSLIIQEEVGPSYVQKALNVSHVDALSIHKALRECAPTELVAV